MKRERPHSHAPTPTARGELHFNELLILVCRASNNNRLDEYLCSLFEVQRREERGGGILEKIHWFYIEMSVRPASASLRPIIKTRIIEEFEQT